MTSFLDTNVLCAALQDDGEVGRILRKKILQEPGTHTSVLAIDELMWVVRKSSGKEAMINAAKNIYNTQNLIILPVSAAAAKNALPIIETHNLKPRDAIHVATMREHNIKTILSFDKDFDRVSSITRVEP